MEPEHIATSQWGFAGPQDELGVPSMEAGPAAAMLRAARQHEAQPQPACNCRQCANCTCPRLQAVEDAIEALCNAQGLEWPRP